MKRKKESDGRKSQRSEVSEMQTRSIKKKKIVMSSFWAHLPPPLFGPRRIQHNGMCVLQATEGEMMDVSKDKVVRGKMRDGSWGGS